MQYVLEDGLQLAPTDGHDTQRLLAHWYPCPHSKGLAVQFPLAPTSGWQVGVVVPTHVYPGAHWPKKLGLQLPPICGLMQVPDGPPSGLHQRASWHGHA
jgi:hypothetical protein